MKFLDGHRTFFTVLLTVSRVERVLLRFQGLTGLSCFNSVHFWFDHSWENRRRFYVALHITRDYFRMTNLIKRGVSVTGMPDPIRSGMY